jgi:ATP-dependent Clp protease ATP-binding subunit ClpB
VFHALEQSHIADIAALQLEAVNARLADRSLTLSVSDEVIAHLADQGFDPVYGARPLKRAIQRLIENPLAEALLAGDFLSGDAIKATMSGGELRFVKAPTLIDAA